MAINPEELTLFNQALYYHFEPEETGDYPEAENYAYLMNGNQQKMDMKEALLYAQNEIYPRLSGGWQEITAEELNHWLTEIHKRCAKTLLSGDDLHGKYIPLGCVVLRWHLGSELQEFVVNLLNVAPTSPAYAQLFRQTVEQFQIADSAVFEAFVSLLRRQAHRKEVVISDGLPRSQATAPLALTRMQLAYYRGQLSLEEKKLIEKFIIVCIPPIEIPGAMHAFATESIQALSQVNTSDEQSTIQTLAEIFYRFVQIHPFANGNGRTGTVLLNLMLVSLGFPSVLLRYPGDKENPTSLYSLAMETIEETRLPLTELLLHRIHADTYTNPLAKTLFQLQLQMMQCCLHAENYFERLCVVALMDKLTYEFSVLQEVLNENAAEDQACKPEKNDLEIQKAGTLYAQDRMQSYESGIDLRKEDKQRDKTRRDDLQGSVPDFEGHELQIQKEMIQYGLHRARFRLFSMCALFAKKDSLKTLVLQQLSALTEQSGWKCKISEVTEDHRPICAWKVFPTEQADTMIAQIKSKLNIIDGTDAIVIKAGRLSTDKTQSMIQLNMTQVDELFPKPAIAMSAACV